MYASTNNAIFSLLSAYICLAYQLRLLRKTCLTYVVINRKVFSRRVTTRHRETFIVTILSMLRSCDIIQDPCSGINFFMIRLARASNRSDFNNKQCAIRIFQFESNSLTNYYGDKRKKRGQARPSPNAFTRLVYVYARRPHNIP